jgi:hypothetical protein
MDSGEISMLYLLNISGRCEIKTGLVTEKTWWNRKAKLLFIIEFYVRHVV